MIELIAIIAGVLLAGTIYLLLLAHERRKYVDEFLMSKNLFVECEEYIVKQRIIKEKERLVKEKVRLKRQKEFEKVWKSKGLR